MNKIIIFLVAALSCVILIEGRDKVLMCYAMSWSVYRPAEGKFDMDDIDPHLCTHIIYAYTAVNSSNHKIQSTDTWADFNMGSLEKLAELKEVNPKLKILIAVGGWNEGSEKFSKMAENKQNRKTFITSVMDYLEEHKLDGLDIDWQFPGQRGGKKKDKQNFCLLLEEFRREFDKKEHILTVRLIGQSYVSDTSYDLPRISAAVHYINLKCYEYHGVWEPRTGVYAPLQSQNEDSVEFSVDLFLKEGVPREKLLLGLSTEGNAFLIANPVHNGIYLGQQSTEGFKGAWVSQQGILGYNEICWELTRSRLWTQYWDKISSTPYAVHGKQFTSFENKESYEEKLKLIDTKNLGGVSFYSLDTDDFKGLCYNQKFILANTAKNYLATEPVPPKPPSSEEEGGINFETSILTQEFPR